MQLSELQADQRTISVPTSAGELKVTYRPSVLTPRFELEMRRQSREARESDDDEKAVRVLSELLVRLLADWDLYDGEEKYPLEPERMMDLPSTFILNTLDAIQEDASEGKAAGNSAAG
jgi:hypothetical protein